MKNQYIGDINDYRKYGLLRTLAGRLTIGVCWMLTAPDNRGDGGKIAYLSNGQRWRSFDPSLFDSLRNIVVVERLRDVKMIEDRKLIPGAVFHTELLDSDRTARAHYFSRALDRFASVDVIFFDPDNSVRYRLGWSRRYVYSHELEEAFRRGHSVLVYQHFPREPRLRFIAQAAERLQDLTGTPQIVLFTTPNVLFLLASQQRHRDSIDCTLKSNLNGWTGQIISSNWPYNGCEHEVG